MSILKNAAVFAGTACAALLIAGCGGPDNEKTMNTNTDGTPTQVEASSGPGAPSSSEAAYKAQTSNNLYQSKGYPKRR